MPEPDDLASDVPDGTVAHTVYLEPAPEGWHRHPYGGGLVEDTAHVDPTAYVGGDALVYGNAQVSGDAWVTGTVTGGVVTGDE